MKKAYDTREGIKKAVATLEGLNLLARERADAGYDRRERLQEWIVLGRLRMDTCGNTMLITEGIPEKLIWKLEPVCTWDEMKELNYKDAIVSARSGPCIPKPSDVCPRCEQGWTMRNWWQAIFVRSEVNNVVPYHNLCWSYHKYDGEKAEFSSYLMEAKFPTDHLVAIPNEYCPCEICAPWFLVKSEHGTLKIGWRKRVINIDWSGMKLVRKPDFAKEEVTKDDNSIHAWGADKAIAYLKEIKRCIEGQGE